MNLHSFLCFFVRYTPAPAYSYQQSMVTSHPQHGHSVAFGANRHPQFLQVILNFACGISAC